MYSAAFRDPVDPGAAPAGPAPLLGVWGTRTCSLRPGADHQWALPPVLAVWQRGERQRTEVGRGSWLGSPGASAGAC